MEENTAIKLDRLGRSYGTGRKKTAIARVWLKRGTGNIIVNGMPATQYFGGQLFSMDLQAPFELTNTINQFDCMCTVVSGGKAGQLGAISLGISRALLGFNPEYRSALKTQKLLTRDSRMVERKKPGRKKARKKFQFSKR